MTTKGDFTSELMAYQSIFKMVEHAFAPAPHDQSALADDRQREAVLPIPSGIPQSGFTVAAEDVYVVDGDTVMVQLPPGYSHNEETRVRVRLRSIEAPELPMRGPADDILRGVGGRLARDEPGLVAKAYLRNITQDREIHVVPTGADRYGRVLADLYACAPGIQFSAQESVSIELEMMRLFAATQRVGEPLPPPQPTLIEEDLPCPDLF